MHASSPTFLRRGARATLAVLTLALLSPLAWADGIEALTAFMKNARSGRADFTQTVTAPAKNGEAPRVKTSTGTFEFQRPGRFRFTYAKPFEQVLVADGQTLWMHDIDMNQVSSRKQAQVLGSTPAAILASAADLSALEKDFALKNAPDAEGLQWVEATPKAKDGQVQSVKVGFKGDTLAALDILDSFGQRSRMQFSGVQVNPPLPAGTFVFKPPAGADVMKQ